MNNISFERIGKLLAVALCIAFVAIPIIYPWGERRFMEEQTENLSLQVGEFYLAALNTASRESYRLSAPFLTLELDDAYRGRLAQVQGTTLTVLLANRLNNRSLNEMIDQVPHSLHADLRSWAYTQCERREGLRVSAAVCDRITEQETAAALIYEIGGEMNVLFTVLEDLQPRGVRYSLTMENFAATQRFVIMQERKINEVLTRLRNRPVPTPEKLAAATVH